MGLMQEPIWFLARRLESRHLQRNRPRPLRAISAVQTGMSAWTLSISKQRAERVLGSLFI